MTSTIKTYYISPHHTLDSAVNVFNIDPYLDGPVTRADLAANPQAPILESLSTLPKEAKTVVKDNVLIAWLTYKKKNSWGTRYVVSSHEAADLAEMKFSFCYGTSTIQFSSSSSSSATGAENDAAPAAAPAGASQYHCNVVPASRLPITVKKRHWYSYGMTFVIDSILYKWSTDSNSHSQHFTLYKGVRAESPSSSRSKKGEGQRGGEVCAKCLIKWTSWTGATIVVDTEKVDALTAILTAIPMLFRIKVSRQTWP